VPLQWTLKKWLAVTHDVYRATDLKKRIVERTGTDISVQSLSVLLRDNPRALRINTIEAICATFQCKLSDFCEVVPGAAKRKLPHRPYAAHAKRKKQAAIADFPSPADFPSTPPQPRDR
jgi:DNA-binding Xre family transcriptional regulator